MKLLLTVHFPPSSYHSLSLRSEYHPQYPVLKHPHYVHYTLTASKLTVQMHK
jgi:hypothetical protein